MPPLFGPQNETLYSETHRAYIKSDNILYNITHTEVLSYPDMTP